MTAAEHLGLVPDPDYCVLLREHGFPQDTKFFWATSGIVNIKQEDIWLLLSKDELEANGLEPGAGQCFAAPVCEEFMKFTPLQYFVTFARFGYIFVDIVKTTTTTEKTGEKSENTAVAFYRIKEADSQTAANCWAKGFCYLLLKKMMSFKKKNA